MKKTFKSIIAIAMSVCMLGAVTACGDSDDDGGSKKADKRSSAEENAEKSRNDDMEDRKFSSDDKEGQEELDEKAKYIYNSANSAICDMDEQGKMTDIISSSTPVLICSDESKNVNASGLDSGFYDCMHEYFSNINDYDWFIVVNKGVCETAVCTESGSEMVGQKPADSYSGKSYEDIYSTAVSEIE